MTTLNDFKQLSASVSPELQTELYSLFTSDPDAARQRMVELAAEQGVTLTVDQVRQFLQQMDEEEEFDDIVGCCCFGCSSWWMAVTRQVLIHDNPQRLQSSPCLSSR